MVKIVGRYGAAGAGNRTLRYTATAAGKGKTAQVVELKQQAYPAVLDEPSVDELRRAIKLQQCCYCKDPRTFRTLSQHWVKAHGINLQTIRDKLEVRKDTSFISSETRALYAERGRRFYDPEKLRTPKGGRRSLSKYGIARQNESLQKAFAVQIHQGTRNIPRTCQVCGVIFYNPHRRIKTCGRASCVFAIRSRAHRGRRNTWSNPPRPSMKKRICAGCGATFIPKLLFGHQRLTCSEPCLKRVQSIRATQRNHKRAAVKAMEAS